MSDHYEMKIAELEEENKELLKELEYAENFACERCQGTDYKCKVCSIHHRRMKKESGK